MPLSNLVLLLPLLIHQSDQLHQLDFEIDIRHFYNLTLDS